MVAFPGLNIPTVGQLAEFARPAIQPLQVARVYLIDPSENTRTGSISGGKDSYHVSVHPYWSGHARMQPIRLNLVDKEQTNDTTTRVYLFQCDYAKDGTFPDVKPGHEFIVASAGNQQLLTQYQYVVTGLGNSTMAFDNNVYAMVDLERRPNYTIGTPIYPDVTLFPAEDVFPNG